MRTQGHPQPCWEAYVPIVCSERVFRRTEDLPDLCGVQIVGGLASSSLFSTGIHRRLLQGVCTKHEMEPGTWCAHTLLLPLLVLLAQPGDLLPHLHGSHTGLSTPSGLTLISLITVQRVFLITLPELYVHLHHGSNQSALTDGEIVCYDPGVLLWVSGRR